MEPLFTKKNYTWIGIGVLIIFLGFLLMSGGGSKTPEVFNPEIFSFTRIRIAPGLVLLGFAIIIRAIFLRTQKSEA